MNPKKTPSFEYEMHPCQVETVCLVNEENVRTFNGSFLLATSDYPKKSMGLSLLREVQWRLNRASFSSTALEVLFQGPHSYFKRWVHHKNLTRLHLMTRNIQDLNATLGYLHLKLSDSRHSLIMIDQTALWPEVAGLPDFLKGIEKIK